MVKFNVQGRKLLIQVPERENVTETGIIIPDTAEMDKNDITKMLGIVLEVGPDVVGINAGDQVFIDPYMEYLGIKNPNSGKECVFAHQDNVLAVIVLKNKN